MKTIQFEDHQTIYVRSMGKALRVTAIADTDDKANEYCAKHKDEGVIAVFGNLVFMANMYDHGTTINDKFKRVTI